MDSTPQCAGCRSTPVLSCYNCGREFCRACFPVHRVPCTHCGELTCVDHCEQCLCGATYCTPQCRWTPDFAWAWCPICNWEAADAPDDAWCSRCADDMIPVCRHCRRRHCRGCECLELYRRRKMMLLVCAAKRRRGRRWLPRELLDMILFEFVSSVVPGLFIR